MTATIFTLVRSLAYQAVAINSAEKAHARHGQTDGQTEK